MRPKRAAIAWCASSRRTMAATEEGLTPPEFLLISLGTCAGFYVVQYLNAHSLDCPELEVKVAADKAKEPAHLGSFRIEVIAPTLDPEHEAGVLRAVHKCLTHNTLLNPPAIETVVHCGTLQS